MNNRTTFEKRRIILIILILTFTGGREDLFAFNLNGQWQYNSEKNGDDQFSQQYSANFADTIVINEAMDLNASLRYSKNKNKQSYTDVVSPSINYRLHNDLFFLNLSGMATETFVSNSPNASNRRWSSDLFSSWEESPKRPRLHFFFGQDFRTDDQNPRLIDSETTRSGGNLTWQKQQSSFNYSYNINESTNNITGHESLTESHFGNFETSESFLENRLNLSLSQQVNYNKQTNSIPTNLSGTTLLELTIAQAYAKLYTPPGTTTHNDDITSNPFPAPVNPTPNLIDDDYLVSAVTINSPVPDMNIGFRNNFVQQVDSIFLYTLNTLSNPVSSAFSFDIYSSPNGSGWTRMVSNATFAYDSTYKRFEIDTGGITDSYLKIVATDVPASSIEIVEMEIFQVVATTGALTKIVRDGTRYNTNVTMSFSLRENLNLTSGLSYEKSENSSSPDSTRNKVSTGINWALNEYISSNMYLNSETRKMDNRAKEEDRSFGIQTYWSPMETLSSTIGASLSEQYEGDEKTTTGSSYNLQLSADLYKDLQSVLDMAYSASMDERTNDKSEGFTSGLLFSARLFPAIYADWKGNFQRSAGLRELYSMNTNVNWRPSDVFGLRASHSQTWFDNDSSSMALSMDLAPTEKIQLSFGLNYSFRPIRDESYSLTSRWNISNYLSLNLGGNYRNSPDGDSWDFNARLSASYMGI